jgi:hypothetical protein
MHLWAHFSMHSHFFCSIFWYKLEDLHTSVNGMEILLPFSLNLQILKPFIHGVKLYWLRTFELQLIPKFHMFFSPYILPQVLMQIIYLYAYIVKCIFWIVIVHFKNDIIYVLVFNIWHLLIMFIKIFMPIPCWKKNGFFNMHT